MTRCAAALALAALLGAPALGQARPAVPAPLLASGAAGIRPAPGLSPRHAAAVAPPALMPVPIVVPPAPLLGTPAGGNLHAALLAIARAQSIDPIAAQTASFQYVKAVQQLRSGDVAGADRTALEALSTASQAQVAPLAPALAATGGLTAAAPQRPGLGGGLYGADAPIIDAESFVALARGAIDECGARHDRRVAAARAAYARAQRDFANRDWQATRADAKAAIDACPRTP